MVFFFFFLNDGISGVLLINQWQTIEHFIAKKITNNQQKLGWIVSSYKENAANFETYFSNKMQYPIYQEISLYLVSKEFPFHAMGLWC